MEPPSRSILTQEARLRRKQNSKPYVIAETRSSQRSEGFLIKNSFLCALSASAVISLSKLIQSIFRNVDQYAVGIGHLKLAEAAFGK